MGYARRAEMSYRQTCRANQLFAVFALVIGCAAAATAQVMSIGGDGSVLMTCTAAQNNAAMAATRSTQGSTIPPAYRSMIARAARLYEISPDLLDVLARQESNYDQGARSPKGAIGIMQLMPASAKALGVDAFDAEQNIRGGAAYLRYMLNVYDGHIDMALSAYNAGQNAVNRYGGIPPFRETRSYLQRNFDNLAQESDAEEFTVEPSENLEPNSAYIQKCR